jgi:membrane protease subunit HflC
MRAIVVGILVIAALLVIGSCFYIVDETELGILLRFGEPVRTIKDAGLYVKWPIPIDRVARFDRRLMVFDLPTADDPPRELLTLDKKNIEVSSYTCWRITEPLTFLETVRDRQGAEAYLGDIVISELGKVLGRHDLSALISVVPESLRITEISDEIHATCADLASNECGVEIVDFAIKRVNFPEQNRNSVFERMRAERKQIATRYRSEGEEKAQTMMAEADRESMEILAEARREALEVQGRADAEATRIYNEAYGQDRDFYEFLRTLKSYESSLTKGTTILLPKEMEYLKMLVDPLLKSEGGLGPNEESER